MRSISHSWLFALAVTLAFGFSAPRSYADGESVSGCTTCNGYSFQATITPVTGSTGKYTLTYTITDVSGSASNSTAWSLKAFSSGSNLHSVSAPTVTLYNSNGSVAGNYSNAYACNSLLTSSYCIESGKSSVPTINKGQSLTFSYTFSCSNCSLLGSWDFLGAGSGGKGYAVANWGSPVSMPEPSVTALYASTIMAVGMFLALQRRRRSTNAKAPK